MYLKSIHVQGFKSFANKIEFEFHNGITAIVGPNGSGKSNVGDAVRWVLGEQSAKQLRGSNMQDIIFSGTENRKPLSYAYVAITLDNTGHELPIDYEEVTVARRVYRSGESEYLINGTSCRLKDVQELFYDTGIGKEGYSLIGQGQIDKILSGKPEERRELFDEAAGIVKFKRRKKAAQKNLENEKQNLVRIQDILTELEKQVEPLQKQSETAKTYLKKREELKIVDANLFLLEIDRIKLQLHEVDGKIAITTEDLNKTQHQYEATKSEYETLQNDTANVEEKVEECNRLLSESSVLSQRLQGELNVLKEQIHAIKDREGQFEERKQTVMSELSKRSEETEKLDTEKQALYDRLNTIEQLQTESQNDLLLVRQKIEEYNKNIEHAKNQMMQMMNSKAATQAKQQHYDTMLEQIQIRKAELNQRILTLKSGEAEQTESIIQYEQELKRISDNMIELSEREEACLKQVRLLSENRQHNTEQFAVVQRDYHRQQSRLDSLINITERYDGYSNAIRRIMEQKERRNGLIGVVADIIKVGKQYEIAIETALGGSIQNIVTDNEKTAQKMIEYLKQNHFGRATFLPLTSIKGKASFAKEEVLREEGVLGIASSLVQTEDIYKELAVYLLGKTYMVETLEHAITLARKFKYSLRIVTLDGELLNPGGSMTGGAFKNTSNLLGRRREIEELQGDVQKAKEAMKKLTAVIEQSKEESTKLKTNLETVKNQIQQVYLEQNTITLNMNQANEKKTEILKDYGSLKNEGREIEARIQEIGCQKKLIQEEVLIEKNKSGDISRQIEADQERLQVQQQLETEMSQEISKRQIEHAGIEQKNTYIEQNIIRLTNEVGRLTQELEELKLQLLATVEETKEKERQIQELHNAFERSGENIKRYEEMLQKLSAKKETLANDNKNFLEKREALLERKNVLDKECYRLNNQKEKLEELNEDSMNYMWEEYELTYNAALPLKEEAFSKPPDLKRRIKELRDDIRKLGNVNVNAIEEYKNVSERYEFLNGQRNDLIEAEKTLLTIIDELDQGMRKQFREKFEQIRIEFDKVFKELFGGGKGTLELEEEDDVLEASIRITSQPPGKKLGNMMQLSGGEKALTAIALLFAIQNLKPSPFCLLDEIEAALDDSNATRYAKYLHKLTENTQFIIITHRRATMASADRLYGITMQEKGVSTLVSVNLIENELDK